MINCKIDRYLIEENNIVIHILRLLRGDRRYHCELDALLGSLIGSTCLSLMQFVLGGWICFQQEQYGSYQIWSPQSHVPPQQSSISTGTQSLLWHMRAIFFFLLFSNRISESLRNECSLINDDTTD